MNMYVYAATKVNDADNNGMEDEWNAPRERDVLQINKYSKYTESRDVLLHRIGSQPWSDHAPRSNITS